MLTKTQQDIIDNLTTEFAKMNHLPAIEGDIFGIGESVKKFNARLELRKQIDMHFKHMYENVLMPLAKGLFEQYTTAIRVSTFTNNLKFTYDERFNKIHPSESDITICLRDEAGRVAAAQFKIRCEWNKEAEMSQPTGHYILLNGNSVKTTELLTEEFKKIITKLIMK